MQYKIFEGNQEKLEKKLVRVQNKCRKYGADFHYEVVGELFEDVGEGEDRKTLRFILVDVSGFARVNDWEFVATIDHHGESNVIRSFIECEVPERYWTSECYCEHCATVRRRKDTFLIRNTQTNEFKQVGRNCLRDFTGGYDAELVAAYMEMQNCLEDAEEADEKSSYSCGYITPYYDLDMVLVMSKSVIAKLGFVSSSSYDGTSSKASLFDLHHILDRGVDKMTQYLVDAGVTRYYEAFEDREYIANLKKYYLESEELSLYMRNMKVIFSSQYCKTRDWGYIVSAVYSYDRAMESQARKKMAEAKKIKECEVSQYLGSVGQKITVDIKEFKCVSSYESNYGISYLYKFIDINGNCLMWSSSNGLEDRSIVTLTGTVKKHEEYNGLKQTWVTRCKVVYSEKKSSEEIHPEGTDPMDALSLLDEEAC